MANRISLKIPWAMLVSVGVFFIYSFMYVKLIVPKFNWGGMIHNPRDDCFFELAFIILTSVILPNKILKPSDFYNWLYFILLLIPSCVLSTEQGSDRFHLLLIFLALWLLIVFKSLFTYLVFRRISTQHLKNIKFPFHSVFLFVTVILIFLALSVRGFFNLNFSEVYEFRFTISENMPLALRYMVPLASSTLIGYLSALSCYRKNFIAMLLTIIFGIFFFGFSSQKSMLFNPFIAIVGYFLYRISRPHLMIMTGFSCFAIFALLLPVDEFPLSISLFANRIVFLPSHINSFYFDFFSQNPFMLWAESKISMGLIDSPLPMTAMNYIGGLMTGSYDIVANTGWVANAYMNGGIFGIIIYSAVIAGIFSLIDFWAKIYGKQFVGAAFLIPASNLIMVTDLTIVLLTGGLIVLLIIFQITTYPILRVFRYLHIKKKPSAICYVS